MLRVRTVPHFPPALRLDANQIGALAFSVAAVAGLSWYVYFNRKPDPAEVERLRRVFLAERGRIIDASLVDTRLDSAPDRTIDDLADTANPSALLRYQYKVGGVGYESVQDVTGLADMSHVRIDLPIQVRYDPHNPGNSIVVAESWSGLRPEAGRQG